MIRAVLDTSFGNSWLIGKSPYPEKIGAAARFWSISAHYRTVQYILYFSTFVLLLLLLFYGTSVKFQMLNLSKFVSLAFKFQILNLSKFVSLAFKFQIFDLSKFVSLAYCCKITMVQSPPTSDQ